jgi:hypothetical protein
MELWKKGSLGRWHLWRFAYALHQSWCCTPALQYKSINLALHAVNKIPNNTSSLGSPVSIHKVYGIVVTSHTSHAA